METITIIEIAAIIEKAQIALDKLEYINQEVAGLFNDKDSREFNATLGLLKSTLNEEFNLIDLLNLDEVDIPSMINTLIFINDKYETKYRKIFNDIGRV